VVEAMVVRQAREAQEPQTQGAVEAAVVLLVGMAHPAAQVS